MDPNMRPSTSSQSRSKSSSDTDSDFDQKTLFKKGEHVWCEWKKIYYHAKILEIKYIIGGEQHYEIHYTKFTKRFDEIMREGKLLKINDANNQLVDLQKKELNKKRKVQRTIRKIYQGLTLPKSEQPPFLKLWKFDDPNNPEMKKKELKPSGSVEKNVLPSLPNVPCVDSDVGLPSGSKDLSSKTPVFKKKTKPVQNSAGSSKGKKTIELHCLQNALSQCMMATSGLETTQTRKPRRKPCQRNRKEKVNAKKAKLSLMPITVNDEKKMNDNSISSKEIVHTEKAKSSLIPITVNDVKKVFDNIVSTKEKVNAKKEEASLIPITVNEEKKVCNNSVPPKHVEVQHKDEIQNKSILNKINHSGIESASSSATITDIDNRNNIRNHGVEITNGSEICYSNNNMSVCKKLIEPTIHKEEISTIEENDQKLEKLNVSSSMEEPVEKQLFIKYVIDHKENNHSSINELEEVTTSNNEEESPLNNSVDFVISNNNSVGNISTNINHVDEEVTTSKLDEEIRTNDQENIVSSNYCLPVDNLRNENFDEEVTTSKPEKTVILDDQQNCIDSVNSLGNKSCCALNRLLTFYNKGPCRISSVSIVPEIPSLDKKIDEYRKNVVHENSPTESLNVTDKLLINENKSDDCEDRLRLNSDVSIKLGSGVVKPFIVPENDVIVNKSDSESGDNSAFNAINFSEIATSSTSINNKRKINNLDNDTTTKDYQNVKKAKASSSTSSFMSNNKSKLIDLENEATDDYYNIKRVKASSSTSPVSIKVEKMNNIITKEDDYVIKVKTSSLMSTTVSSYNQKVIQDEATDCIMSNEDSIFNKSNSENEKERNYYENKIIGGNGSFVKNTEHCASNSYEGGIPCIKQAKAISSMSASLSQIYQPINVSENNATNGNEHSENANNSPSISTIYGSKNNESNDQVICNCIQNKDLNLSSKLLALKSCGSLTCVNSDFIIPMQKISSKPRSLKSDIIETFLPKAVKKSKNEISDSNNKNNDSDIVKTKTSELTPEVVFSNSSESQVFKNNNCNKNNHSASTAEIKRKISNQLNCGNTTNIKLGSLTTKVIKKNEIENKDSQNNDHIKNVELSPSSPTNDSLNKNKVNDCENDHLTEIIRKSPLASTKLMSNNKNIINDSKNNDDFENEVMTQSVSIVLEYNKTEGDDQVNSDHVRKFKTCLSKTFTKNKSKSIECKDDDYIKTSKINLFTSNLELNNKNVSNNYQNIDHIQNSTLSPSTSPNKTFKSKDGNDCEDNDNIENSKISLLTIKKSILEKKIKSDDSKNNDFNIKNAYKITSTSKIIDNNESKHNDQVNDNLVKKVKLGESSRIHDTSNDDHVQKLKTTQSTPTIMSNGVTNYQVKAEVVIPKVDVNGDTKIEDNTINEIVMKTKASLSPLKTVNKSESIVCNNDGYIKKTKSILSKSKTIVIDTSNDLVNCDNIRKFKMCSKTSSSITKNKNETNDCENENNLKKTVTSVIISKTDLNNTSVNIEYQNNDNINMTKLSSSPLKKRRRESNDLENNQHIKKTTELCLTTSSNETFYRIKSNDSANDNHFIKAKPSIPLTKPMSNEKKESNGSKNNDNLKKAKMTQSTSNVLESNKKESNNLVSNDCIKKCITFLPTSKTKNSYNCENDSFTKSIESNLSTIKTKSNLKRESIDCHYDVHNKKGKLSLSPPTSETLFRTESNECENDDLNEQTRKSSSISKSFLNKSNKNDSINNDHIENAKITPSTSTIVEDNVCESDQVNSDYVIKFKSSTSKAIISNNAESDDCKNYDNIEAKTNSFTSNTKPNNESESKDYQNNDNTVNADFGSSTSKTETYETNDCDDDIHIKNENQMSNFRCENNSPEAYSSDYDKIDHEFVCGSKSICLANNCNHSVDSDGEIDGQTTDDDDTYVKNRKVSNRKLKPDDDGRTIFEIYGQEKPHSRAAKVKANEAISQMSKPPINKEKKSDPGKRTKTSRKNNDDDPSDVELTLADYDVEVPLSVLQFLMEDKHLIEDERFISRLPAIPTVHTIVRNYALISPVCEETLITLFDAFSCALDVWTLHPLEKPKHYDLIKKYPGVPMCQIYGLSHFLRFIIKLPKLFHMLRDTGGEFIQSAITFVRGFLACLDNEYLVVNINDYNCVLPDTFRAAYRP